MNLFVFLCLLLLLPLLPVFAQTVSEPENEVTDAELYTEAQHSALTELSENPVDLNRAGYDELKEIPFLSEKQVRSLLEHRKTTGHILSIYELQSIEHFDISVIRQISPFVRVSSHKSSETEKRSQKHSLIFNTEYTEPRNLSSQRNFTGSLLKINGRYRFIQQGKLSLGVQFDKDAGEPVRFTPRNRFYGFDFYSFHITVFDRGIFKKISLGDYTIQHGQGLVFGTGFALGKSMETITAVRKSAPGIKPFTSVAESGYFRGAAVHLRISASLSVILFSSFRHQDGTPADNESVSSIISGGYHRTLSEQAKKHNFFTLDEGLGIRYQNHRNSFSIGSNTLYTWHSRTLLPGETLYNSYYFRGNQNWVSSMDFSASLKSISLFGEGARSLSGANACIVGSILPVSPTVDWAVLIRSYDRHFHSFYSNALSENSSPFNERGLYSGIRFLPGRNLTVSAYADLFRFPWLSYQIDRPSAGEDLALKIEKRYNRYQSFFIQIRTKSKDRNTDRQPVSASDPVVRQQVIIQFRSGNDKIVFNSRLQYIRFRHHAQINSGIGILNDLSLNIGAHSLSCRIALFDTDNFETGLYSYEKDLLYNFSVASYYGQGFRLVLNSRLRIHQKADIRFKLARFTYFEALPTENKITNSQQNNRNEVKIQLIIRH